MDFTVNTENKTITINKEAKLGDFVMLLQTWLATEFYEYKIVSAVSPPLYYQPFYVSGTTVDTNFSTDSTDNVNRNDLPA